MHESGRGENFAEADRMSPPDRLRSLRGRLETIRNIARQKSYQEMTSWMNHVAILIDRSPVEADLAMNDLEKRIRQWEENYQNQPPIGK